MGHFAKVENGLVTEVIVAEQDFIDSGAVGDPNLWIKTSYNTRGGIYYEADSNTPAQDQSKALRANFAGVGYSYDSVNDVFIPPPPVKSWVLDTKNWQFVPPIPYPDDYGPVYYVWDESTLSWSKIKENIEQIL